MFTTPRLRPSTVAAQFNAAGGECQAVCRKIQAECASRRQPFFDEAFWYGKREVLYPKGAPADCTVVEPTKARRATELYPNPPRLGRW